MSTHLRRARRRRHARGLRQRAHRTARLPAVYNRYLRTAPTPATTGTEAEQMLLRPLFVTSFLIDD